MSSWAQPGTMQHQPKQDLVQVDANPHLSAACGAGFRELLPVPEVVSGVARGREAAP